MIILPDISVNNSAKYENGIIFDLISKEITGNHLRQLIGGD